MDTRRLDFKNKFFSFFYTYLRGHGLREHVSPYPAWPRTTIRNATEVCSEGEKLVFWRPRDCWKLIPLRRREREFHGARGKSNISKTFHRTCILLLLLPSSSSLCVYVYENMPYECGLNELPAHSTFKPAAECAASPLCAPQSRRPSRFYYNPTKRRNDSRGKLLRYVFENRTCNRERTRIQF